MLNGIKADIDHARSEACLAVAEVIFRKPAERRVEAEPFDLRPPLEETPSLLPQRQRVAPAEILRCDDLQIRPF